LHESEQNSLSSSDDCQVNKTIQIQDDSSSIHPENNQYNNKSFLKDACDIKVDPNYPSIVSASDAESESHSTNSNKDASADIEIVEPSKDYHETTHPDDNLEKQSSQGLNYYHTTIYSLK
jgi:hypothetical protein